MTKFEELVADIIGSRQDLTERLDEVTPHGATHRAALQWFVAVQWANDMMEYATVKDWAELLLDNKPVSSLTDEQLVEEAIPDYDAEDDNLDTCVELHAERCAEIAGFIADYRK